MYNEKISTLLEVKRNRIAKLHKKQNSLNDNAIETSKELDVKIEKLRKKIKSLEKLENYVK